jgi:two-component system, NarL family, sensor histidine kinase UhpB
VVDDGRGFAFDESEGGLGIAGMRERALLIGGELTIESRPGRGTTVRLHVPG